MASLTTHTRKDGTRSYYVKWYDRELRKDTSQSFRDRGKAETLKLYLDANQNTLSLARQAKKQADSAGYTVWDAVQEYLDDLKDTDTSRKYRRDMDRHLRGTELAGIALSELEPKAIATWLDGLRSNITKASPEGEPAAWKTKSNRHAVVSSALKRQVGKRLKENPAFGVLGKRDELPTHEPVDLSLEQLRTLRERAQTPFFRLIIWTLTVTGMRWGELVELRRKDLHRDPDTGQVTIRIRRAIKNNKRIGLTKTMMSRRDVPLDLELSRALWAHAEGLRGNDLIFPDTDAPAQQLYNGTFHKQCWQPLMHQLESEGVLMERPWVHDLRHNHIAHLLRKGVRPNVVQKRVGHERLEYTLRIYDMISMEDDQSAALVVTW
ncbi:tyrosine-type recombinase/integrase [Nesterenkonia lacusekhoensis]|uniref:Integrase n=1 Tax=Nesterenkonia lacusekhoensis TaxID=150832 RepID=A0ABS4T558_9MICC|nr:tyrosine-type recombinase/integrase [Nesterenkonia lacusekhoensis]MBP2319615.1 integrase [Nesterenkonia lacusekhoensis]